MTLKTKTLRRTVKYAIPLAAMAVPSELPAVVVDLTSFLPAPTPTGGSTNWTMAGRSFQGFNAVGTNSLVLIGDPNDWFNQTSSYSIYASTIAAGNQGPIANLVTANTTSAFAWATPAGQTGWLRVSKFGASGDLVYLAAAYQTDPNASLHIGDTGVPEPTTAALAGLAALALGATGIGRLRNRTAEPTEKPKAN
jgi:hypothetical protein